MMKLLVLYTLEWYCNVLSSAEIIGNIEISVGEPVPFFMVSQLLVALLSILLSAPAPIPSKKAQLPGSGSEFF